MRDEWVTFWSNFIRVTTDPLFHHPLALTVVLSTKLVLINAENSGESSDMYRQSRKNRW